MILPRACKPAAAAAYTLVAGRFGTNISVFDFDGKSLSVSGTLMMPINPSWIEPGGPKSNGSFFSLTDDKLLISLKLDGKGNAEKTGEVALPGEGPVHILHAGEYVAIANYGSGSVVSVPVGADGVVAADAAPQELKLPFAYGNDTGVKSTVPDRQDMSRAHGSVMTEDGSIWTADLGSDSVWTWGVDNGAPATKQEYKVPPGFGPRHLATPDGKHVYVIGEIANEVVALQEGKVASDPVSILPPDLPAEYGKLLGAGELVAHPTFPTTLYASNRNQLAIVKEHPDYKPPSGDAVAILSVTTPGEPVKVLTHIVTKCDHIRGMKVSPDGKFVAVGGLNNKMLEVYAISGEQKEVWTLVASSNEVDQIADVTFFPKA